MPGRSANWQQNLRPMLVLTADHADERGFNLEKARPARKPLSCEPEVRWNGWLMQEREEMTVIGSIMVVRHTGKVGRVFGKIYVYEIIQRLRFSDGYEATFRLTDLQAASAEQIGQFEREELRHRTSPSPPPPRLFAG